MDQKTLNGYSAFAGEFGDAYARASGVADYFAEAFPIAGCRVLDVGCGTGRDLSLLLKAGYDAFGAEPSEGLRAEACRRYPEVGGRLFPFGLPLSPDEACPPPFEGILCSAVFMHIPAPEQERAMQDLHRLLTSGGHVLLSLSAPRPGLDADHRDDKGRLFTPLAPDQLADLLIRCGFSLLKRWRSGDGLGRPELDWHTFLARVVPLRT